MTHYINPKAIGDISISEMVKELTNGRGVDYSFECTGVPDLVNEALETTKMVINCPITQPSSIVFETATNSKLSFFPVICYQGVGKTIMLGAGTQKSMEIDFISLLGCRTFKYSIFGGVKVQSDLPIVIDKCINKVE